MKSDEETFTTYENETLRCRKNGYPLIARIFRAINHVHSLAGIDSPCRTVCLKDKLE